MRESPAPHDVLESLLNEMSDGFVVFDQSFRVVTACRTTAAIVGRRREDLAGLPLEDAFPESMSRPIADVRRRVMRTRNPEIFVDHYPSADRWFETRVVPLPGGIAVFYTDVSDRKKADATREALAQRHQAFVDTTWEAMLLVALGDGPDGVVVEANESAADLLGTPLAGLLGQQVSKLLGVRGEDFAPLPGADGHWPMMEFVIRRADGTRRHTEMRARLLTLAGQRYSLLKFRDASAQRREALIRSLVEDATSSLDLDDALGAFLDRTAQALGLPVAVATLLDDAGDALVVRTRRGPGGDIGQRLDAQAGALGDAFRTGQPQRIDDIAVRPTGCPIFDRHARSAFVVPVAGAQGVVGVFAYGCPVPRRFEDDDVALIALAASRAGAAIDRARIFAHNEAVARRLADMSLAQMRAVEEERRRVARELHDQLGQGLTALAMQIEALGRRPRTEGVKQARAACGELIEDVRRLAMDLRPAILDDFGLVPALEWMVTRWGTRTGIDARFVVVNAPGGLDFLVETAVFRSVQEALHNAARHARATHVTVWLDARADGLRLSVADDGVGFSPHLVTPGRGSGLSILRERSALVGGRLDLDSAPEKGTRLSFRFPMAVRP